MSDQQTDTFEGDTSGGDPFEDDSFEVKGVEMRPATPNGMNVGPVMDILSGLADEREEDDVEGDSLLEPVTAAEQASSGGEVEIDMRVLIRRLYDADGILAELNPHLFWKAGTEEPIPEDVAPYVPIDRVAPTLMDFLLAHGRLLQTLAGGLATGE